MSNIYDLSFKDPTGKEISLSEFDGKALLLVNTATECGLKGQFSDIQELYAKYKDDGLVVVGFPCAQFAGQEPQSNETVVEACKINFGVTYQLSEKIKVNGKDTHPIFVYLKDQSSSMLGSKIKWNFTKFLVSRDGNSVKRFAPATKPSSMVKDIQEMLSA